MNQLIEQGINVWETWIEYDPSHPDYFGTLYIHGETLTDKKDKPALIKTRSDFGQLTLEIASPVEGKNYLREVFYSEPIKNLNQYTSVNIYSGAELIAYFDQIETLI